MVEPSLNGCYNSPSSLMSPLSVPKTPVVGDWPSDQRQRSEVWCRLNLKWIRIFFFFIWEVAFTLILFST